jgi:hypothetical protein
MLLKEKGLSVSEWLTTYNLTKGGRKSSCPCNLGWLYWEMNPNRIPLANDVIYEILSEITTECIKDNYKILISENTKEAEEIVTIMLKSKTMTPQNIIISIAPLSLNLSIDNVSTVSIDKKTLINKINNIIIANYKE